MHQKARWSLSAHVSAHPSILVLSAQVYVAFVLPVRIAYFDSNYDGFDYAVQIIFLLDIVANFFTIIETDDGKCQLRCVD